ncbi:M16 family metallopeptidase [Novosphingobium sp.]|jgi:zinc protease|uniref:M16 family metallopeptidase n=1 Tax=Novosphingobium sp. TaxID=1874826 RepID=UPI002FDFC022
MKTSLVPIVLLLAASPLAASAPDRADDTSWAFESSDVPMDAGFRVGRLANGMRYVVRHNGMPAGTVVVRMDMNVGSLDEAPGERGFAHFLEHMAFNGSRNVPEGQMVPLLERAGLAFGSDTNASTNFSRTLYKLDLPRADRALLDTALMLMRETASNLTIAQDAVARERGVVLAEMRDRDSPAFRSTLDGMDFFYPGALYTQRLPIGTTETLEAATAASLRAFYEREYVPAHATLVVVGDIDVDAVEADIRRRFGDWQPRRAEAQPDAGPIDPADSDRVRIYTAPSLSEKVTIQRNGAYIDEADTLENREQAILRAVGYAIVNRRLSRLASGTKPPFRSASFGTGDLFDTARSTALGISTVDGAWQAGMNAAGLEYRRALEHGFTEAEVAEQVARLLTGAQNAAASAETRGNKGLAQLALGLVDDRVVPSTPQSALERIEELAPRITPEDVLQAMLREAVPLDRPMIRFTGRKAPEGGEGALRSAWASVQRSKIGRTGEAKPRPFAYTTFGTPGQVVSDKRSDLGIRQVRFANGVMVNLRRTGLEKGRIRFSFALDGGNRLNTRENPRTTQLVSSLAGGGLGRHSADELRSILAGRSVGMGLGSGDDSFDAGGVTTPRDLELQLQLLAALITDPGYRPEGEVRYRQSIDNRFAQIGATPKSAMQAELGSITSGGDPRFSLGSPDDYRSLSFTRLKADIGDRLAHGAIEIGLVGDVDEEAAIALVARTFGALPQREAAFGTHDGQAPRVFPKTAASHVIRHKGPANQAILRMLWPTRDDADPLEEARLELLHEVMNIRLTEQLREKLGKAYSPGSASLTSHVWKGYGYFQVNASIDAVDIPATRNAIEEVVADLRAGPVDADTLQRAREPVLQRLANALKSNGSWMSLVARSQSEPERISRFEGATDRLRSISAVDLKDTAVRYLRADGRLEVLSIGKSVDEAKTVAGKIARRDP